MKLFDTIYYFSSYSGLNPNISKYGIFGVGALKGFHVAVCGLKFVDLTSGTLEIFGFHFSYNKKTSE